ncbi:MAG TPA: hypothetical protein VGZ93_11190 [Candidatus Methylacidiphilales bacterium]|jgi:hypothetical protein|nr:hypothetical protein [Candidatus Methylacidiphilales bacterium]
MVDKTVEVGKRVILEFLDAALTQAHPCIRLKAPIPATGAYLTCRVAKHKRVDLMKAWLEKLFYSTLSKIPFLRRLVRAMALADEQEQELGRLRREFRECAAELQYERHGDKLREILALLRPMKVVGFEKVRVGAGHDGGYVMLDDFEGVSVAHSLGIADDVSWDLDIARRGIKVIQSDYSVGRSPVQHPLFTFRQRKIAGMNDILESAAPRQMMKIDIEGSEWGLFDDARSEDIALFTQIVGEFHTFSLYYREDWHKRALGAIRKLSQTHQIIHIHGNNAGFTMKTGTVDIPTLLELTFVLRSNYRFEPTEESFPGPLDRPNVSGKADIPLDGIWNEISR